MYTQVQEHTSGFQLTDVAWIIFKAVLLGLAGFSRKLDIKSLQIFLFWHLHFLILLQWVLSEFLEIKLVGWMGSSWMSELSAQILFSSLPSVSPLSLQHHVLLSQKCWSRKTVFYFCLCYTCEEMSCGHILGLFSFWQCVQLCVCCLCCATVLNSVCLTASGLSFFFFIL